MRPSALATLTVVLLLSACQLGKEDPAPPAPAPVAALPKGPGVPVQAPPGELRGRLEEAYALQVDQRFVLAVDEVRRLTGAEPCAQPAAAVRDADGWSVSSCGEEVGRLPPEPDLPDALRLLEGLAAGAQPGPAMPARGASSSLPLLTADDALARLSRLARAGPRRSRAEVHALAASLSTLAFALPDGLQAADALGARALAAVAIDRALGAIDTAREEALVALALGYRSAASAASGRLAEDDALRAYVDGDGVLLERALRGLRSTEAVQLLWLRHLTELGDSRAASLGATIASRRHGAPLELALVRSRDHSFDAAAGSGEVLVSRVLSAGGPGRAGWRWNGGPSLKRLRQVLARAGEDERLFLWACFVEGVRLQVSFALDYRSVPAEASAVLEKLGGAEPGTPEDGLRRWIALRVKAAGGGGNAGELLDAIGALPGLGGGAGLELLGAVIDQLDHGDPALVAGLRRVVKGLDGRPGHRSWIAGRADRQLQDLRLLETMLRQAARLGGDPHVTSWLAKLDGDASALRAMAADPRRSPAVRARAIALLAMEGAGDDEVERLYRSLLSAERDDWDERSDLVRTFEQRRRWGDAETLVRDWLAARHPPRDLHPVHARAALARALSQQGRDAEALEAIEPVLGTQAMAAMERGAMVMAALGNEQPARALGEAVEARYPGADGAAVRAAVHWRLGDHAGAAKALAGAKVTRVVDWAREVAPRFVRVFEKDPAGALAALDALRLAQLDPIALQELAAAFHREGNDSLAFELASRLRGPGLADLELALTAYGYLDAVKGRAAARAWLDGRVPPPLRPPLGMMAFAAGRDEVLWDLAQPPAGNGDTEQFMWLMHAAASLRTPLQREQEAALAARFSREDPGFYHRVGRFLLGYDGPEQVLKMATAGKRACEASYYLGFKAQQQGDLATASDWYRAAVENGTPRDGEYRWASEQLHRWTNAQRSLKRLAAEPRTAPATAPTAVSPGR